jgi:NitT/TauT family transport system substrate-binding protein
MTRWISKRLAIIVIAIVAAFSCRQKTAAPSSSAAAPALETITMNLNPVLTYGPLMLAIDSGYFREEGLNIEIAKLDSNSALAAAASGKLDVLSAGVRSGVFNMIARGVPMRVVADKGHSTAEGCSADAFVAPVAIAQRIKANGGSLKGERLVLVRGGLMEYTTMKLLETRRTRLEDVTIVHLPAGTPATNRDRTEAVRLTTEPNLSGVLEDGWAEVVATAEEVAPGHQNALLIFGKRLRSDRPELGHRFMRAYLRGVRQYNEGKTDRNVASLARHTKLPEELIRKSCWIAFRDDGFLQPEKVQPFLDWAHEQHLLDQPLTTSQWWDPTFVEAARTTKTAEVR